MSNYGESYYLEELEEMQKEKVITINPKKQIVIDKSDLDFIYKQKADLEAKLTEKERQLKLAEELLIKQEKEYDEQLEKQAKIHYRHLKEKDQDKISFAVEQLEKVLKTLEEKQFYKKEDTAYCVHPAQIAEYIDNQIAELKKEMK